MSNLENLTNRIIDEANQKAEEIATTAFNKGESILKARVKEAEDLKAKMVDKAKFDAEMIRDRAVSGAELTVRDNKLRVKQEMLDKAFEKAKTMLKELPDTELAKYIEDILSKIGAKEVELRIPKGKSDALASIKNTKLIEDDKLESGFVIRTDEIIYDYSFTELVDELREELEGEIAKELFKE